jgi:hypothetical protein
MPVLIYPWRVSYRSVLRTAGLCLLHNIPIRRLGTALDGLQPDICHEVLWVLRVCTHGLQIRFSYVTTQASEQRANASLAG